MTATTVKVSHFSAELRASAAAAWDAQLCHPFVRSIGDGSLSRERFVFYLEQDYLFLIEYARLLALGVVRSSDLGTMRRFSDLAQEVLATEMDLHRSYCLKFGIAPDELENVTMAPTTRGYTDFLLRTAALDDFGALVAALLPCMWGYHEVGLSLAKGSAGAENPYSEWIDMYSSEEFGELTQWCIGLMDSCTADLGAKARQSLIQTFLASSRYELAFWQMAWDLQRWPA